MGIKRCRICNTTITQILSLGKIPIVNYFPSKNDLKNPQDTYPLVLCVCSNCSLAQINEILPPEKLFTEYHYFSSTSLPLQHHLSNLAVAIKERFSLARGAAVFDIGCNDAVLLSTLQQHGIKALGVDPSINIQKIVRKAGVKVLPYFFNNKTAIMVNKRFGQFDVIFATNALAQIVEIHDFIAGVEVLLKKDGIFVVEVGYVVDMMEKKTFDAIYHEHYSYFSVKSLTALFKQSNLEIFDVEKIANHGGSIRVFIKYKSNKLLKETTGFKEILEYENSLNLNDKGSYKDFGNLTNSYKENLRELLKKLKKEKKKIVGIGAPAKSVVLLNFCGISTSVIDYIVDSTPHKHYRFMPGVNIPIFPEDYLWKDTTMPDYIVLLAWTYKEEILKKLQIFREKEVKIIIPFPRIEIL